MKITIFRKTKDIESIKRIREKFKIPSYTTINGETESKIKDGWCLLSSKKYAYACSSFKNRYRGEEGAICNVSLVTELGHSINS